MDMRNSMSPSGNEGPAVVEAATLKDALRLVRQRYGVDARVIRSRTINRRQRGRLGAERVVEVLVEPPTEESARVDRGPFPGRGTLGAAEGHVAREIAAEVDRIEALVRRVAADHERLVLEQVERQAARPVNPLARALVAAGAGEDVVSRVLERLVVETGSAPDDSEALARYLEDNLPTGSGSWEDFGGGHVFVGPSGAGKSSLVYTAAARLRAVGRRVLVLSLLPRHAGEIRRLQMEASQKGYDAAIIQDPEQLESGADHFAEYDAVLMDTPAWDDGFDEADTALRAQVVRSAAYHRHVVFPLDRDPREAAAQAALAREWNADWVALTRLDQVTRHAKLLDVLAILARPVSLLGRGAWSRRELDIADPAALVSLIMDATAAADAPETRAAVQLAHAQE